MDKEGRGAQSKETEEAKSEDGELLTDAFHLLDKQLALRFERLFREYRRSNTSFLTPQIFLCLMEAPPRHLQLIFDYFELRDGGLPLGAHMIKLCSRMDCRYREEGRHRRPYTETCEAQFKELVDRAEAERRKLEKNAPPTVTVNLLCYALLSDENSSTVKRIFDLIGGGSRFDTLKTWVLKDRVPSMSA